MGPEAPTEGLAEGGLRLIADARGDLEGERAAVEEAGRRPERPPRDVGERRAHERLEADRGARPKDAQRWGSGVGVGPGVGTGTASGVAAGGLCRVITTALPTSGKL